jgi:hypothetical protein
MKNEPSLILVTQNCGIILNELNKTIEPTLTELFVLSKLEYEVGVGIKILPDMIKK